MTNLLALVAAIGAVAPAGGPLKIDGAKLATADIVTSGAVTVAETGVTIGGGRLTLSEARQKALDTQLANKPLTLLITVVDNAGVDTTALTFGTIRLLEKDKGWYLVNNPAGAWHQVALGIATKGEPLRFAVVAQDGAAHIFKDGKDVGTFPYKPEAKQALALGSPDGEANPFKGEVKDLDLVPRPLLAEDIAKRYQTTSTTTAQPTTNPGPTTKSTVIEAELVDLTEVPDPNSILPYKHALIVHEYKVASIKSGNIEGVTTGAIVRVGRWGIVGGKKTDIATLKKGAKVTLTLERFSDHPSLERQYTINKLPENYDVPYLLDANGG